MVKVLRPPSYVKHFIFYRQKRDDHIRPSYVTLVLAYDDVSFARAHHTSPTIWQSKQAQLVAFGLLHFFPQKKIHTRTLIKFCSHKNTCKGVFSLLFVGGPLQLTTLQRDPSCFTMYNPPLWDGSTSTYPSPFVLYTFTVLLLLACVVMDTSRTNQLFLGTFNFDF